MNEIDQRFMREALRQARRGLGRTSPNPAVGAVIVRKGRVIASGYHRKAGEKHAEAVALDRLGGRVKKGDTLYVTLEPCNHHGRTPPCTETILRSGIERVVVGMRDPNPDVSGGGCEFLAQKGVSILSGILETECCRLNESFIKFVATKRPFVIAKSALTLDGWTATSIGHSKWITNEKSRRFVHLLRDRVDGIMVGIGTVLKDDPLLTTRLENRPGRDPARIIVDPQLRIPHNAKVLNSKSSAPTLIVVSSDVSDRKLKRIESARVTTVSCQTRDKKIDLPSLLDILGKMSMTSLMVEGGPTLMGSFIRERLVDKFYIFKAPKILGGNDGTPFAAGKGPETIDDCLRLKEIKVRRFRDDILIRGYPDYH